MLVRWVTQDMRRNLPDKIEIDVESANGGDQVFAEVDTLFVDLTYRRSLSLGVLENVLAVF